MTLRKVVIIWVKVPKVVTLRIATTLRRVRTNVLLIGEAALVDRAWRNACLAIKPTVALVLIVINSKKVHCLNSYIVDCVELGRVLLNLTLRKGHIGKNAHVSLKVHACEMIFGHGKKILPSELDVFKTGEVSDVEVSMMAGQSDLYLLTSFNVHANLFDLVLYALGLCHKLRTQVGTVKREEVEFNVVSRWLLTKHALNYVYDVAIKLVAL